MARLFYMSLPDIGDWSRAMREVGAQLAPYRSYLRVARTAADNRAHSLAWRLPTADEERALAERLRPREERVPPGRRRDQRGPRSVPQGTWILLEARPGHGEEPEATFEAFLDAQEVYDRPPLPKWLDVDKSEVRARDREARALLLAHPPREVPPPAEAPSAPLDPGPATGPATGPAAGPAATLAPGPRPPVGPLLFLRPNTWSLECQRRTLEALEGWPAQRLAPLVRLATTAATWSEAEPVAVPEDAWAFLRAGASGALRDGTTEQRELVRRALGTPDFAVLEGPPGSGKTTALCELIVQLARAQKRVLLVASTHVAVDNVLERLIAWQDASDEKLVLPIRIGDEHNVTSSAVEAWTLPRLTRTWRAEILDHLDQPRRADPRGAAARDLLRSALTDGDPSALATMLLEASNLVCGTTIGILQHPAIKAARKHGAPLEPFDYLILDEASRTTFAEFLVPAIYAKRWVIVGDRRQLSPYVDEQDLAENLRGLLRPERARAAVHAFAASASVPRKMRMGSLVAVQSDEEAGWLAQEAAARGVAAVDLDAVEFRPLYGVPDACAALLYADLVFGKPETIAAWQHRLPGDLQLAAGDVPALAEWEAHRRALHVRSPDEAPTWAGEVAWRQVRAHELRHNEGEQKRLLEELRALRPIGLAAADLAAHTRARTLPDGRTQTAEEALEESLANLQRVSLPSILEILQRGAGALSGWRDETVLTAGLPSAALRSRMVSLSFQHRMHPDISAFPRQSFYAEDGLLNDATGLRAARAWAYPHHARRAVWIDVTPRQERHAPRNSNPAEADEVIKELRAFGRWAERAPGPGGDPNAPWQVAVLTFYRGQEKLLRERLQQLTGQRGNSRNFQLALGAGRVHVTLCTVDRFQGHEADLVLLSFVKSGSTGFLNSPNRLNVALTRARYQLVMVGHRRWLASQACRSELLRNLGSSPLYAHDLVWGNK